jgi:hypothetical protein
VGGATVVDDSLEVGDVVAFVESVVNVVTELVSVLVVDEVVVVAVVVGIGSVCAVVVVPKYDK